MAGSKQVGSGRFFLTRTAALDLRNMQAVSEADLFECLVM